MKQLLTTHDGQPTITITKKGFQWTERPLEVHLVSGHNGQTERSQLGLAWCGLQNKFSMNVGSRPLNPGLWISFKMPYLHVVS